MNVLASWKEVANYLGKGVRTVQRYEKNLGFPIRRPSPDSRVIFAIREEVDAWVQRCFKAPLPRGEALDITRSGRNKQRELLKVLGAGIGRLQSNQQALSEKLGRLNGTCHRISTQAGRLRE